MLTIAYCRVSTEEQASEGYSIEGQAEKLRAYASLRDLGPVTVIEDGGQSGKNTDRPGLQRLLKAVAEGHVSTVLVWKLDRLSRNLGDLILLADTFLRSDVSLYSFTEQLDLSSATGRMFYNILGAFAQFYREQLIENVRMGMGQAVRQGKWINRPKTGYYLIDGDLIPNEDAPRVLRIFGLRAEGKSYREIEDAVGIKYSTAMAIVASRIYLGEVLYNGEWFPGVHEAIVTPELFNAAQRGHLSGRRQSTHLLASRVRCGLCGRSATTMRNQDRDLLYRCKHRGQGCKQPGRSARGLQRAVLLGLRLISEDEQLREAIRRQLTGTEGMGRQPHPPGRSRPAATLAKLTEKRRKLLELYYAEKISPDLFTEEEQRINRSIEAVKEQAGTVRAHERRSDGLAEQFEKVVGVLRNLDVDRLWAEATDAERRVLIEEMVESIEMFPDHIEVKVAGAPRLNVLLKEVGLREPSSIGGVGGGT